MDGIDNHLAREGNERLVACDLAQRRDDAVRRAAVDLKILLGVVPDQDLVVHHIHKEGIEVRILVLDHPQRVEVGGPRRGKLGGNDHGRHERQKAQSRPAKLPTR